MVVLEAGERRQLGTVRGEGNVMLVLLGFSLGVVVVVVVVVVDDRVARVDSVVIAVNVKESASWRVALQVVVMGCLANGNSRKRVDHHISGVVAALRLAAQGRRSGGGSADAGSRLRPPNPRRPSQSYAEATLGAGTCYSPKWRPVAGEGRDRRLFRVTSPKRAWVSAATAALLHGFAGLAGAKSSHNFSRTRLYAESTGTGIIGPSLSPP